MDSLYVWFDEEIGASNTGLYAANEYVEQYQVINEKHRFFESPNYIFGTIWYKGSSFHKVLMKYDLFKDQIIVSLKNSSGVPPIKLQNSEVDSFYLRSKKFRKIYATEMESDSLRGFYEVMEKSPYFTLYKKYKKIEFKRLNRNNVYYEFKDKNEYVIEHSEKHDLVRYKKDLLDIFPIRNKVQRKFLATINTRSLSDDSIRSFLNKIITHLNENGNSESK